MFVLYALHIGLLKSIVVLSPMYPTKDYAASTKACVCELCTQLDTGKYMATFQ